MRRLTLIATLALVGLTACGSDNSSSATTAVDSVPVTDSSAPVDTATLDTTQTTAVDSTLPNAPETTMAGGGAGAGSPFCELNTELNDGGVAMDGTDTPASLENYFTVVFPEQHSQLEGVTPPELTADVATLIDGVVQLSNVLEANDWDLEASFSDPALETVINDAEFEAAGSRVDAYCGV